MAIVFDIQANKRQPDPRYPIFYYVEPFAIEPTQEEKASGDESNDFTVSENNVPTFDYIDENPQHNNGGVVPSLLNNDNDSAQNDIEAIADEVNESIAIVLDDNADDKNKGHEVLGGDTAPNLETIENSPLTTKTDNTDKKGLSLIGLKKIMKGDKGGKKKGVKPAMPATLPIIGIEHEKTNEPVAGVTDTENNPPASGLLDNKDKKTPTSKFANSKEPAKKSVLGVAVGMGLLGATIGATGGVLGMYAYQNKQDDTIVKPEVFKNLSHEVVQYKVLDKETTGTDMVVWEVKSPNGSFYPMSSKDGKALFLGKLTSGVDESLIIDVNTGEKDEELPAPPSDIAVDNKVNEGAGTAVPVDDSSIDNTAEAQADEKPALSDNNERGFVGTKNGMPVNRWGATASDDTIMAFSEKRSLYKNGVGDDYFSKALAGTGAIAGVPTTGKGVGNFQAEPDLFARHLAEFISREATHNRLGDNDVINNPQNYVYLFHKHDCVYCKKLITAIGETNKNIVFIPLVNNAENFKDDLTSDNVLKSVAILDNLYPASRLEQMSAQEVKLKKAPNEQDLKALQFNTVILQSVFMAMDFFNKPLDKNTDGSFIFATPTVVYFDRNDGEAKVVYNISDDNVRKEILGL